MPLVIIISPYLTEDMALFRPVKIFAVITKVLYTPVLL